MDILPLVSILMNTKCDLDPSSSYQNSGNWYNEQSFDFIVVGGGSAGSVVASRLSENTDHTQYFYWKLEDYPLLVQKYEKKLRVDLDVENKYDKEMGGSIELKMLLSSNVPGYALKNVGSERDWSFKLEPGNYALSAKGEIHMPRGKVLGGSGSINGMIYVHSLPSDYDKWAALGNPGWDYKSVLKYFKKAENAIGNPTDNFGTGGPITIQKFEANDPFSEMLKESLKEIDVPILEEEGGIGFFPTYRNIQNGTRCSTAKAYLSNLNKSNLQIVTKAHVMNIIFKGNKAVGVKVSIDGNVVNLYASKEVILSAGTISTPQILLLSGIGPIEDLTELGIPLKANLPVGKNMLDHFVTRGFFVKLKPSYAENICVADAALQYCLKRDGPMTYLGVGAMEWSISTKKEDDPDMFLIFSFSQKEQPQLIETMLNLFSAPNETYQEFREMNSQNDVLLISTAICYPKSTGVIKLRSTNPFDPPLIYPNYFTDANDEDILTYVNSVDYIKRLVNSTHMRNLNAELVMPNYPNCKEYSADSPEFYKCAFRNMEGIGAHITSTCKMGPRSDRTTVVDHTLRVHGIDGLRVVDASVMPTVPNRNTNAPTIMIAEKGADMIKEHWDKISKSRF